ncbi:MAG: tRNA (adenosine(37)-N6)-dimethylallyltransferase MiaA [Desulfotomaculaceae bacterium]|nr:tRNA (adenosine(37)-N6)-dimethylallyltransferase MiaA [Desulfotomaculaceae bacterium]MDD4766696.1 tRNA (adenosine(37)-N6)-dimethylallyltransferase MiaA [Desulfotomaculaceae bacterium]
MKDLSKIQPPLVVICGPTATGKSDVGVQIAEKLHGEIISADSMLVYRGMDIGTAKPTPSEMRGIPHHLIDIVEPNQEYNAALFQEQARSIIADIMNRKKLPILVGGTGLYIGAVIDDYEFSGARGSEVYRKKLLKDAEEHGVAKLHERLREIDPGAAAKLHPHDTRRIIRALEVYKYTGTPISSFHKIDRRKPIYNLLMFGLSLEREKLYKIIEQRVELMIQTGLIEEVQRLLNRGFSPELSSMRGLGYKEIVEYLQGERSLAQSVDVLKRNTRRFAKRQMTWFRRDNRIKWLNVVQDDVSGAIINEISRYIEGVS